MVKCLVQVHLTALRKKNTQKKTPGRVLDKDTRFFTVVLTYDGSSEQGEHVK